jgi:hypothetical protein
VEEQRAGHQPPAVLHREAGGRGQADDEGEGGQQVRGDPPVRRDETHQMYGYRIDQ